MSSREQAWDLPLSSESCSAIMDVSGQREKWTRAQRFIFHYREEKTMNDLNAVEILLVEDNPRDAELTIRALKKKNLANHLFHVEDGVEALDYLFARGKSSERNINDTPKVVLLDLKLP